MPDLAQSFEHFPDGHGLGLVKGCSQFSVHRDRDNTREVLAGAGPALGQPL